MNQIGCDRVCDAVMLTLEINAGRLGNGTLSFRVHTGVSALSCLSLTAEALTKCPFANSQHGGVIDAGGRAVTVRKQEGCYSSGLDSFQMCKTSMHKHDSA